MRLGGLDGAFDRGSVAIVSSREKLEKGIALEEEEVRMRVIDLPLSATEDRVSGTLDLEHVLKTGEKKFEPGVLASANGTSCTSMR